MEENGKKTIFPPPSEKNNFFSFIEEIKKKILQGSNGQLIYMYLLIIRNKNFSSGLKIEKKSSSGH